MWQGRYNVWKQKEGDNEILVAMSGFSGRSPTALLARLPITRSIIMLTVLPAKALCARLQLQIRSTGQENDVTDDELMR